MSSRPQPPPWEVLVLVAQRLGPKTLAVASCVSKSWNICMSSDHVWQPICTATFPSLSRLGSSAAAAAAAHPNTNPVSYHRLFSLARVAAKRRLRGPPRPRISLHDLVFAIHVYSGGHTILHVVKPGSDVESAHGRVFRFDVGVNGRWEEHAPQDVVVSWNVVLRGWRAVFCMMDCGARAGFAPGSEGWFSEELPSPMCCSSDPTSGVVADLKLGISAGGSGKVKVDRVSVGMLSIVKWRYVSVDDGLRYLQHFLMPCGVAN